MFGVLINSKPSVIANKWDFRFYFWKCVLTSIYYSTDNKIKIIVSLINYHTIFCTIDKQSKYEVNLEKSEQFQRKLIPNRGWFVPFGQQAFF